MELVVVAYISIFPKSTSTQGTLIDNVDALSDMLFAAVKQQFGVPDADIIVELNQCTAIAFNKMAVAAKSVPDVVIKIETSDHQFQPRFRTLRDEIITCWNDRFGQDLALELWINLIDTWGSNIDFA